MKEPRIVIGEVTDPVAIARARAQDERARRNDEWLQAHWPEIAPRARGRFLAVAGQEAFIADTWEEAWQRAQTAHPDDDGAHLQYVIAKPGPRIYADRG
jgi:type II secretory pathway component PulM